MAESFTQDKRIGELKPVAGLGAGLVLTRFVGNEGFCELFELIFEAVRKAEMSA
jgi:hypothetical protein